MTLHLKESRRARTLRRARCYNPNRHDRMFTPSRKHPRPTNPEGWGWLFVRRSPLRSILGFEVPIQGNRDLPYEGPKADNLSIMQRLKKRMGI